MPIIAKVSPVLVPSRPSSGATPSLLGQCGRVLSRNFCFCLRENSGEGIAQDVRLGGEGGEGRKGA